MEKLSIPLDSNSNINNENGSSSSKSKASAGLSLLTTPSRQYVSRRSKNDRIPELPVDVDNFVGYYSPWALLWGIVFMIVPAAYIYILLVVLREICMACECQETLQLYIPRAAQLLQAMQQKSSRVIEVWCAIEAIFYVCLKLHIHWLQRKDTLEASLSAAPLMSLTDREILWKRMMETEDEDTLSFVTGWFFDQSADQISKYDVRDFIAWSMFEGRHQEHLTTTELEQLEQFVQELEVRISLQLYGEDTTESARENMEEHNEQKAEEKQDAWLEKYPKPKQEFHFHEEMHQQEPNFFSNLYESYRTTYENLVNSADFHPVQEFRNMVKNAEFHPVQDLRNLVAETAEHIAQAEESAKATASQMYETIIPSGSQIDKHLSAMSQATYLQLTEAWNSVKNIKERLETAEILSKQRQRIRQQLRSYRAMLNSMREMASAVPSKQMAILMRKITECNEALEHLESRAQSAFVQATGFARKNLTFLQRRQPARFAKYSSDPLLGIATYPLGFHLLILGGTEIPLRIMLSRRGFERKSIGPVSYYFHPGTDDTLTPTVFVHGIGIGLIAYVPLIDALLATGRPIMLPEIPYVSGFRPLQGPSAVLSPAVVSSTMTAMLASHGYLRATWVGHSYGTSWVSYMCKYAAHAVAAAVFLDPICFCLHVPRLTKQFVYMRPDPGTISYVVRTDVTVNWTIQRSFPWAWIILFIEQIEVPWTVFLSDRDALVPATKVEHYFLRKKVTVVNVDEVTADLFQKDASAAVFRGAGHGDWCETPSETVPRITLGIEALCRRADAANSHNNYNTES